MSHKNLLLHILRTYHIDKCCAFVMYLLYVVLADANFPSASVCKNGPELLRADGEPYRGLVLYLDCLHACCVICIM